MIKVWINKGTQIDYTHTTQQQREMLFKHLKLDRIHCEMCGQTHVDLKNVFILPPLYSKVADVICMGDCYEFWLEEERGSYEMEQRRPPKKY